MRYFLHNPPRRAAGALLHPTCAKSLEGQPRCDRRQCIRRALLGHRQRSRCGQSRRCRNGTRLGRAGRNLLDVGNGRPRYAHHVRRSGARSDVPCAERGRNNISRRPRILHETRAERPRAPHPLFCLGHSRQRRRLLHGTEQLHRGVVQRSSRAPAARRRRSTRDPRRARYLRRHQTTVHRCLLRRSLHGVRLYHPCAHRTRDARRMDRRHDPPHL